jgi:hypothetical protein
LDFNGRDSSDYSGFPDHNGGDGCWHVLPGQRLRGRMRGEIVAGVITAVVLEEKRFISI